MTFLYLAVTNNVSVRIIFMLRIMARCFLPAFIGTSRKAAQESITYFEKKVHEETRKVDGMSKRILLMESILASKSVNVDVLTYKQDALAKENEALLQEVEMNVENEGVARDKRKR